MAIKVRLSEGGNRRTVYVEHGIWWNPSTRNIHVTIPGDANNRAHWSYSSTKDPKKFAVYKQILVDAGRWPDDAP